MSDVGDVLDANSLERKYGGEKLPRGEDGEIGDWSARVGGYSTLRGDGG